MKKIVLLFCILLSTCNIIYAQGIMGLLNKYQINNYIEYAEQIFIEKAPITEREALSDEIDYYKPPYIKVRKHVRDLTGKDIIHICNIIERENEEKTERLRKGETSVVWTPFVGDIKGYALDNPNKIIAHEFYFSGTFTIGDRKNKYRDLSRSFIILPKLEGAEYKYRFFYTYEYEYFPTAVWRCE
jgi:hypothetical protein